MDAGDKAAFALFLLFNLCLMGILVGGGITVWHEPSFTLVDKLARIGGFLLLATTWFVGLFAIARA